ncbi:carbohydrate kinase [Thermococcus sp. P6]|uniref:carbohydrate kinase n=1 Tax=Thermococcus sp. P6 TaxID=122420 RepID=UPI000B5A0944|nr:carbohydrate kinase [Thermococcus sp. P6]ASJ10163.1 carbohydrate kinase [Thermococcus sp. P6]
MKCLLVGHLVIDRIIGNPRRETRMGGGAYYSAMALSNLCDVEVLTSVGDDFPEVWLEELRDRGIRLRVIPSKESTSYELRYIDSSRRELRLLSRAGKINEAPAGRYDMITLNPVAGEVPPGSVETFRKRTEFLAADVQGFIRSLNPGKVELRERDASFLHGLKVLHSDLEEMVHLKNLQTDRVEVLLATNGAGPGFAYLQGRAYTYRPIRMAVEESTGAGDVFLAAFSYFYRECPFVQALKKASAFTALFLKRRNFSFSMEEVSELAMNVEVERFKGGRKL